MLPYAWFSLLVSSFVSRTACCMERGNEKKRKNALSHTTSSRFLFHVWATLVSVYSFTLKGKIGDFLRSIVLVASGFFFSTAPFILFDLFIATFLHVKFLSEEGKADAAKYL